MSAFPRIAAGIGLAIVMLSGTAVATAAPSSGEVSAAACEWGATRPYKYQDEARGTAYSTGCVGGSFGAALQHHRAWGWSPIDNRSWTGNATWLLSKTCDNKSNFQYRTMISARNNGGGWTYRYSATHRFVC